MMCMFCDNGKARMSVGSGKHANGTQHNARGSCTPATESIFPEGDERAGRYFTTTHLVWMEHRACWYTDEVEE